MSVPDLPDRKSVSFAVDNSADRLEISICEANPILAAHLLHILQTDQWISDRFCVTRTVDATKTFSAGCAGILLVDPSEDSIGPARWQGLAERVQNSTALIGYCGNLAPTDARALMASGFRALIPKTVDGAELVRAVSVVSFNGTYIHDIYCKNTEVPAQKPLPNSPRVSLTERETEVLRQLALGNSLKEIAASLNLSTKTVDTYKTRANCKLDLRSRSDIVRFAIQSGWMKDIPSDQISRNQK